MFFELLASFVQGVGAIVQGNAGAKAANYNKRIDLYNANVTEQEGQIAETQLRQETARRLGSIRANVGASGLSGGSASDLLEESAYNAEMDALNTRYNYKTKAQNYRMQGDLEGMRAKNSKSAGYLNAGSILLAGSGKAYQQYTDDNAGAGKPFRLGS